MYMNKGQVPKHIFVCLTMYIVYPLSIIIIIFVSLQAQMSLSSSPSFEWSAFAGCMLLRSSVPRFFL